MTETKLNICIVAQNAFGALTGGRSGHVGGAEHQTAFLARWLAAHGHTVSLVTWDEGQADGAIVDGVRSIKMCRADAGVPGLRFFHPRLSSLLSALRRADADTYYHNSAEYVTGIVGGWCRRNGRKFVYSVASDIACEASLPAMSKGYERFLYRRGLRLANKVIVQTERQRQLLRGGFGLEAVVLPMPCAGPSPEEFERLPAPRPRSVAWVGRAAPMKRLGWMLEVAEKMPEAMFHLAVANAEGSPEGQTLHARAKLLPNVVWLGTVERAAMPGVYREAACLCCTSSYEGFPNTFLEAWSHGRPVITSFDPDNLVMKKNLGAVATSVDGIVSALREVFASKESWLEKSACARRYYFANHPPEKVMPMLERELVSTLSDSDGAHGRPGQPHQ